MKYILKVIETIRKKGPFSRVTIVLQMSHSHRITRILEEGGKKPQR